MANPYSYGSLGERWADGNPTDVDSLNKARIKNDANRWTLQQIMADPDNPEAGPVQPMPSNVYSGTDEDGREVHAIDLDNPMWMWNLRAFRQYSRTTSWYAELGHMPPRLLIFIPEDEASIEIYDRATMTSWATFTSGSNLAWATAQKTLWFLDGILYCGGNGAASALSVIDFVTDQAWQYTNNGCYLNDDDIGSRDAGNGVLLMNAAPAINSAAVKAVGACRDMFGNVDSYGRPYHRVLVTTEKTGDNYAHVLVPPYGEEWGHLTNDYRFAGRFYAEFHNATGGSGQSNSGVGRLNYVSPRGHTAIESFQSSIPTLRFNTNIHTMLADAWGRTFAMHNTGTGGQDWPFTGGNGTIDGVGILDGVSCAKAGSPILLGATDEGVVMSHIKNEGIEGVDVDDAESVSIVINATANWPPYFGTDEWTFSYALENANELFGSKTLTASGAGVTHAAGVIGNGAHFDGVDYYERAGDSDFDMGVRGTDFFSYGFWFKSDSASNPGSTVRMFGMAHSTGSASTYVEITSNGDFYVYVTSTGGGGALLATTTEFHDGEWHFVWVNVLGTYFDVWVDGNFVNNANTTAGNWQFDEMQIGARPAGAAPFTGTVDQLSIHGGSVASAQTIWYLYERGRRALESSVNSNDALDANGQVNLAVDQDSKCFATCSTAGITIFDRWGIPILEDASPGGNINDIDLWSTPGSDDLSYAMITTTDLEVVQQAIKVAERA